MAAYTRSVLYSFFYYLSIDDKDGGYLWSALDLVAHHHAGSEEVVHLRDFASRFTPESIDLLIKLHDKMVYSPVQKVKAKAVVHIDEDDEEQVREMLAKEMAAAVVEEKVDAPNPAPRAMQQQQDEHKLSYASLIFFLLFTMSLPSKELARWLYWLWYSVPAKKVTKDNLIELMDELWSVQIDDPRGKKKKEKYSRLVKRNVLLVDEDFNSLSFEIYDVKTGGAWSRPLIKLRSEIYQTLAGKAFWARLAVNFWASMKDGQRIKELEDLQLRGAPVPYRSKGERKEARREVRRFRHFYLSYAFMVKESDEEEAAKRSAQGKALLFPALVRYFASSRSSGEQQERSERGEEEEDEDVVENRKHPPSAKKSVPLAATKSDDILVPLEHKYRLQLRMPQIALKETSKLTRAASLKELERCLIELEKKY